MAVSNDLLTDQRVARHRQTLVEAGCDVLLVGRNELKPRHSKGWLFYAELNHLLWRRLRHSKVDIVWANDTDTLLGCFLASRRHGVQLVMDAHELFPEVPELQHKPLVRWVWHTIERMLMPQCNALLTVCQSIADHYRHELGVRMEVVRNLSTSSLKKEDLPPNDTGTKTLLYQGCVNIGRGVDWAIDALEWLPDCRLVVAGGGDLLEAMQSYACSKPWSNRIEFTGRMTPEELHALTPHADVGLVMLEDMGLSYHYALPNRIGDLVQAGVPMVVSDLPEMASVVRHFRVGAVMREPGAKALAEAVRSVLARQWSGEDFSAARHDMDWKKEKEKLIEIVEQLTEKL